MATDQYVNSASPDYKGPKGIHLPLAKLLLDKIPSDYEIVVIPASFGGTGFTTGESCGYDSVGKKPQDLSRPLKWGVGSAYLQAIKDRIKHILDMNPANYYIGMVWCQGESDADNATEHNRLFDEMMTDFFAEFNGNQKYKSRVKSGTWGKEQVYIFETTAKWKENTGVQAIWAYYKTWNDKNYVEIAEGTPMNETPSTTSPSNPQSHYGQNAYADVIVPAVFAKMVANGAV